MGNDVKRVAIIGGGITGLTAAYYLQKESMAKGLSIEYRLIEASNELGGKVQTDYTDGFVIERGPDSFLARKTSAAKLAKEVGLEDELVHNDTGKSYVLNGDKLYPMPGGAIMGIPTQLTPFAATKLFSPVGKLRAAGDLVLPKTTQPDVDQSLGSFFRKRLGNEVVDRLIEPLLSGIYAGDIDKLSLMATFPQFHQVEQKHRSLILGMKNTTPKKPKSTNPTQEKPKGMFLGLKRGLCSLVDSIENHLDEDSILKGTSVTSIVRNGEQFELTYSDGRTESFDRVIMTTPFDVTKKALNQYSFVTDVEDIPATSVATVAMAFPEDAIQQDIEGTGFVVSKKSDYTITACTWTHRKWKHSTPEGYALLRGYVGRAGDEEIVYESDDVIIEKVLSDLNKIMDIKGEPEFFRITRWKNAMPQYVVGHKKKIENLTAELHSKLPGLYLAGAPYEGIGLPDCIDSGEKAVSELLSSI
ncbi:protoporphyrinogen oxidase [Desertibacillus haloalkaliphilus]|uniref:protoporphyrinogen oxidase n=1 Tax=Desertibacillus haloalkaliphilus TaxID=1328930 RepID=UPI001C25F218|nr:protoporphyrinogen oxidase [Desertibacillus haloalkaliphilus]MBU8905474.1 protoporphyrinogen oxidase [Desertibacillus haloalkaliphilus]